MQALTPISEKERIQVIDVIRGFAILGIFLVNMPDFNSPIMYLKPGSWSSEPLDRWTEIFIDIFAQASFYTLFSFLFGFGAMIFRERALMKGYSASWLFARRLIVLFLIGCVHAFLIWHGDILISYALTGAIFLLFYNAHERYLLIGAAVFLLVPNTVISLLLLIPILIGEGDSAHFYNERLADEALQHYRDGTFSDIFWQRWHDWVYVNGGAETIYIVISLLPMFLLGAYAAKKQWFTAVEANEKILKRISVFAFVIGIIFKLLPYWSEKNVFTEYVQHTFGGPATAIFYAVTMALLSKNSLWNKLFSPLAAVGRMSLTNYLFQSIVCTVLFYSYGLGLYGSVRPFYGLLLTIAIYGLQLALSTIWLSHYRMGPLEWIWRTLTYGQKQPFKKGETYERLL
ncbi:DUF418 domain-containing protein [Anoxybacteroides tepidamans]|uniref:DUF418 domain-containing protein n=1 Tax=Anoxybacteroides tepidamans TaxID=265948 RepID=UPI000A99A194|nr:DUF418 domain-containing protein [Anoxybacillus tepidamans]